MKKLITILIVTLLATAVGLYFRPSYALIGQLDWWNVITKGYFVGSFVGLFSKGFIDESFWFVMRFTIGGAIIAVMMMAMMGKSGGKKTAKKKK
jgi:hypothetical protein